MKRYYGWEVVIEIEKVNSMIMRRATYESGILVAEHEMWQGKVATASSICHCRPLLPSLYLQFSQRYRQRQLLAAAINLQCHHFPRSLLHHHIQKFL
jgi:hypothetical protein